MIEIDRCGKCAHFLGMIDGWKPKCEAFPAGIPAGKNIPVEPCTGEIVYQPISQEDIDED